MKKSLLALAVLGAFTGVASAQSSVSLYGTVDLNGRYVKNDGSNRRYSLSQDGLNSSQLGFRGTEDLGGGLKAGFLLLAGVNADTGTTNSKFFNRRATVSLMGGFGEVRLGRDYVPTFWNQTIFDAFGTNGLGDSRTVKQLASVNESVRSDNSIGYFLPSNLGGIYGQFMASAGEGSSDGRYLGGRVGFATGPFDVAASYGTQRLNSGAYNRGNANVTGGIVGASGEQYKTWNVGGSYDFGFAKILGYYNRETIFGLRDQIGSLSAVVPLGQGEVHVGGEYGKFNGPYDNKVKKFAVGYVYNLSKRTALYGTAAYQTNDNNSAAGLTGNGIGLSGTAAPTLGGKSKGAEVGVRHFF